MLSVIVAVCWLLVRSVSRVFFVVRGGCVKVMAELRDGVAFNYLPMFNKPTVPVLYSTAPHR